MKQVIHNDRAGESCVSVVLGSCTELFYTKGGRDYVDDQGTMTNILCASGSQETVEEKRSLRKRVVRHRPGIQW